MNDLETIVGRAIFDAGINLTPQQRVALQARVVTALRDNAQVVRMEMEHIVWGMAK
jgi:hypothetical protein